MMGQLLRKGTPEQAKRAEENNKKYLADRKAKTLKYYGLDKPPPSKIEELLSKGIGFIPGVGTLSRIADFASGHRSSSSPLFRYSSL